jgi:hypothetical protein
MVSQFAISKSGPRGAVFPLSGGPTRFKAKIYKEIQPWLESVKILLNKAMRVWRDSFWAGVFLPLFPMLLPGTIAALLA